MKNRMKAVQTAVCLGFIVALSACGRSGQYVGTEVKQGAESTASENRTEQAENRESGAGSGGIKATQEEIRIGMVNPLSGDNALYGLDQERGLLLAFEEINEAGGVNGAKLVLDEYDDQGDPQSAAKGAQKYADDESIMAITGSSLTSCTLAMVPIIDDAEVVECVVSSSSPSLANCSDYFFRMAVQDGPVGLGAYLVLIFVITIPPHTK